MSKINDDGGEETIDGLKKQKDDLIELLREGMELFLESNIEIRKVSDQRDKLLSVLKAVHRDLLNGISREVTIKFIDSAVKIFESQP